MKWSGAFGIWGLAVLLGLTPTRAQADVTLGSLGSGFYISQHQVLTNWHVVRTCTFFMAAHQDQDWFPAKLLYADPAIDLALIWTGDPAPKQAVFESAMDTIDTKDLAVVGFPNLGRPSIRPFRFAVRATTNGVETSGDAFTVIGEFHPGNSGSPVVDRNGTVVGIIARGFNTVGRPPMDDGGEAISQAAIARFLNAHHVPFQKRGDLPPLSDDDQFDSAKSMVVQIGCWL